VYSSLRGFARELCATLLRLAAYCGTLAALAYGAAHHLPQVLEVSPGAAAGPGVLPEWADVERPFPAFEVATSEFDGSETHYVIRRHPLGGRKDVFTFGNPAGPGSHLLVEIYRAGAEQQGFAGPAAEIAARIPDVERERIRPAGAIATRFGPFRLVDFAADWVGGVRQCLGFVRTFEDTATQIAGTYCREGAAMVDRAALACALDRLVLIGPISDRRIADLFARAQPQRGVCGPEGAVLAATGMSASWLDGAEEPKLRGRLVAQ
jgi:hypothetical protein